MKKLIDRLHVTGSLDREQWIQLLSERSEETDQYARDLGNKVRQQIYGNDIYVRGQKCPEIQTDRRRHSPLLSAGL